MYDFGYLKTPPGLLTSLASILNIIAFICVVTTEEKTSIHAGFLVAVTILGVIATIAVIICHVVLSIARKIPPYPFALTQVCMISMHWPAVSIPIKRHATSFLSVLKVIATPTFRTLLRPILFCFVSMDTVL